MPRPPPPKHSQFKKGVSGNPGGVPKYALTQAKVKDIASRVSDLSVAELEEMAKDKSLPMAEAMFIALALSSIKSSDPGRIEAFLNRAVGKVKDEIEQTIKKFDDRDLEAIPREALIKLVSGE